MGRIQVSILFTLLLLSGLIFQNCGKGFESARNNANASCQPQFKSVFQSSKLKVQRKFLSAQSKMTNSQQNLSLIIDVACVEAMTEPLVFFDQDISIDESQHQMTSFATNVSVDSQVTDQEIENALNSSSCFIGLAEDIQVQKTAASAVVNDPFANNQRHLDYLRYDLSLNIQQKITQSVVVAIVDSGIDYNHTELSSRMWRASDNSFGYDFVNNDSDPFDDDGHGTHLAGIIGAEQNNSSGGAGLTESYTRLMAVKVLDDQGGGSSQDIYNGIMYAISQGADVINLSVESPGENPLMQEAIGAAVSRGIVVTAAAGNGRSSSGQGELMTPSNLYAPAYLGPDFGGMISVTSVDVSSSGVSGFAHYGSQYIEMAAPGAYSSPYFPSGGVLSTAPNNQWSTIPGTSQATPMVSSAAAMLIGFLKTKNIGYTPFAIEEYIKDKGSWTQSSITSLVSGGKILDLGALAQNLANDFPDNAEPPITLPVNPNTGNKSSCP